MTITKSPVTKRVPTTATSDERLVIYPLCVDVFLNLAAGGWKINNYLRLVLSDNTKCVARAQRFKFVLLGRNIFSV